MPGRAAVVAQLENLRAHGMEYLYIPALALDWIAADRELSSHLARQAVELTWQPDAGAVFRLVVPDPERAELQELRVSRVISPNDLMYTSGRISYFDFGRSGLSAVRAAIASVGNPPIASILDLPSGHGRVLRYFAAAFPDANLAACDLDQDGVNFCATAFNARPVYSVVRPQDVELADRFDVIWVGSLLTHLDAPLWDEFLEWFADHLTPTGVLVVTFHGAYYRDLLSEEKRSFYIPSGLELVRDYDEQGFSYQEYIGQDGYGISLSSPEWVASRAAFSDKLEIVEHRPRGWLGEHDLLFVRRRGMTKQA
jgi:SAM-dependent methyltransferase